MLSTKDSLYTKGRYAHVESEKRKKKFHANSNQKKVGVALLIPNKIHLKSKTVTRDKEGHYNNEKMSIHK